MTFYIDNYILLKIYLAYQEEKEKEKLKITQVEMVPVTIPTPMRGPGTAGRLLLVKIHTDEGITGIGDAGGVNQDMAIALIKTWEKHLIGANPLDREIILSKSSPL